MSGGLSLLGAFTAGLLSFFAPCTLPMVPVYLAYLAGERELRETGRAGPAASVPAGDTRFLAGRAALFVLGFSAVFVVLGASATALGRALLLHRTAVRQAAGLLLVLFGLHLSGLVRLGVLERSRMLVTAAPAGGRQGGWWRAFLLGVAFSAGWQPCIGPVLGGILALAGAQDTVSGGVLLLLAYAAGLALPFIAAAAFLARFREKLPALLARSEQLRRTAGYLLILMGALVFFNLLGRLGAGIGGRLPLLTGAGVLV